MTKETKVKGYRRKKCDRCKNREEEIVLKEDKKLCHECNRKSRIDSGSYDSHLLDAEAFT